MAYYNSLIVAGFGGQGVLLLGQIVATAGMKKGYYVSWMPSYGPEMRGGTASCTVIVSDEEIGAPVVSKADNIIVLNQPSLEKYEPCVKEGGILIYNSSIVKRESGRDDIKVYSVPCNEIALKLGNEKVANIVALGALIAVSDIVEEDLVIEALKEVVGKKRPELIDINLKALQEGKKAALKD